MKANVVEQAPKRSTLITPEMAKEMLDALQLQSARYRHLLQKEKTETGGETHGTCAYLQGAITASQRAAGLVEKLTAGSVSVLDNERVLNVDEYLFLQ